MKPVAPPEALMRYLETIRAELPSAAMGRDPPARLKGRQAVRAKTGTRGPVGDVERALVTLLWIALIILATLIASVVVARADDGQREVVLGHEPAWSAAPGDKMCGEVPLTGSELEATPLPPRSAAMHRASTPPKPVKQSQLDDQEHAALAQHGWAPARTMATCMLLFTCIVSLAAWTVRRKRKQPPEPEPMMRSDILGAIRTHRGAVRRRNEDAIRLVSTRSVVAVVVADGLGGHAEGARASRFATDRAAAFLERRLEGVAAQPELVRALIAETFARTARLLARTAYKAGYADDNDGMRTTLAIAVVTKEAFVVGMLGDGSVMHVRAGDVRALVEPQRDAGNFVAGSLGAVPSGMPVFAIKAREADNEALIVVTDGIGDIATDDTYRQVAQVAWSEGASRAADLLLDAVLKQVVDGCPLATDNVSVGLLVTGGLQCRRSESA